MYVCVCVFVCVRERGLDLAVDARGVDRLRLREEQDAPRLRSRVGFYLTECIYQLVLES